MINNSVNNAIFTLTFTSALIFSTGALAQTRTEDAIQYRQSAFKIMAWQLKPISEMVKGTQAYNKDVLAQKAALLEQSSKLPMEGFLPGTDKGETKALPEVWTKPADFKQKMEKMQVETAKLASIAKGGDMAKIKTQYASVAAACKECHEDYKRK